MYKSELTTLYEYLQPSLIIFTYTYKMYKTWSYQPPIGVTDSSMFSDLQSQTPHLLSLTRAAFVRTG